VEFGKKIADNVVRVERSGEATLRLDGEDVPCEILNVTYTPSTYERQHPESVTYWIDPAKHLVLKEALMASAGRNAGEGLWTLVFDSVKFNRPIPEWARDVAKTPEYRERTEWTGKAAPAFSLPDSDGSVVTLSSLRGKTVLLDFWSILCGPCKLEMPMIEEVGRTYEGRGVVLLGISFDPAEKSKAWIDQNKHTLRTLTDADFAVADAYRVGGIPALVLIGRDGRVKRYWDGSVTKETIEAALDSSLK
jgi:peroxiredoxin